ncbi:MAG: DUF7281 domain-containing protein [Methylotenera sp.]
MFDHRLAGTLKRVLSKSDERYPVTISLTQFINNYSVGRVIGKSAYFNESEKKKISELLIAKGFSLENLDISKMPRTERLLHTPNEKSGGGAVKRDRISIKHLNGKSIEIAGEQSIRLPAEAHLDMNWRSLKDGCRNDSILLVENYVNFNLIHQANFDFPAKYTSPLVLYRGDQAESRNDIVMQFLQSSELPVLAYVDIDPAGLAIASKLPRLGGIVSPDMGNLEKLLSSSFKRQDLYDKQCSQYSSYLDSLIPSNPSRQLWEVVKKYRAGVVQERFLSMNLECILWGSEFKASC